jgi:NADPH:quinone reductase
MKAIPIPTFGCSPSDLKVTDYPDPYPLANHAVIAIKAFGINHAEMHMRRGEWAEAAPISGIECVGIVHALPPNHTSDLKVGDRVATWMGGLGRSINGTYAEYTSAPFSNIIKLPNDLNMSWADMAALPESYATAWTVLFRNLKLQPGQKLLIRGGTSALGKAAINLAAHRGKAEVWATTRKEASKQELLDMGVKGVIIDDESKAPLSEQIKAWPEHKARPFDAVLLLTGNAHLIDTLRIPRRGGHLCLAGFLSGLAPIEFNPILQMASGVQFSFFGSFVFGTSEEWRVDDVPLGDIMKDVSKGKWAAGPWKVFKFEETWKTHEIMENGKAGGKMVVVVSED